MAKSISTSKPKASLSKTTTRKSPKSAQTQENYTFDAVLEASGSNIYQVHCLVPDEIATALLAKDGKRVVAILTTEYGLTHEYQCGLQPIPKGCTSIMVNKEIRKKLSVDAASRVRVQLRKDTSEYGLEMPEELAELLQQDEAGNSLFHALTAGKQRTMLYIVSSVKSSERRIERAIIVLEHLKEHHGKIDFKRLYDDMRVSKRYE
jgi:hypothetical protein